MMALKKVISGGQTGIDRMGLEVARDLGIETGGTAPKHYWTENGPDPTLAEFNLAESPYTGYSSRTRQNVADADATVIFGNANSAGSKLTLMYLRDLKKPYIINPTHFELTRFLENNKVQVLNVAGNRGSKLKEDDLKNYIYALVHALMYYTYIKVK